jgi:hypothetical protein
MLIDLKCQDDTKAYIIGIYGKYKSPEFDLSKDSVGLLFLQARMKQDFATYQKIADWLLFCSTYAPSHLKYASKDYYDNIAQLSYYTCYRMVKTWRVYEQLADEYIQLTNEINNIFIEKQLR